jgi:hypothetical protein
MTDTKNEPAWPEKVYGLNDDLNQKFRSMRDISLNFSTQDNSGKATEYTRADLAQPQFTPEQLQSVLDTIMKCQDMARYERDYSLQDELTIAIALLKGMK